MSEMPKAKRSKVMTSQYVDELGGDAAELAEAAQQSLAAANRVFAFVRRIQQWRAEQSMGRSAASEIELHDTNIANRFYDECDLHVIHSLDDTALGRVLLALAPKDDDIQTVLKKINTDAGVWALMVVLHGVPMTGGVPDAIEKLLASITPGYGAKKAGDEKELDDEDWRTALCALSRALEAQPWWPAFEAFAVKK